jgi:hypothetical protein
MLMSSMHGLDLSSTFPYLIFFCFAPDFCWTKRLASVLWMSDASEHITSLYTFLCFRLLDLEACAPCSCIVWRVFPPSSRKTMETCVIKTRPQANLQFPSLEFSGHKIKRHTNSCKTGRNLRCIIRNKANWVFNVNPCDA